MDAKADAAVVYTLGHSTRSLRQFLELLELAAVRELVDVRSIPRSRRHPHFGADALAPSLAARGIDYVHEAALGGFRRPERGSPNRGWSEPAFQGYADHMASEAFRTALGRLEERSRARRVCVMCAEAQWWRCHRRLLADALLLRGWRVLHLGLGAEPMVHELTPFAVVGADRSLTYPPLQTELRLHAPPAAG